MMYWNVTLFICLWAVWVEMRREGIWTTLACLGGVMAVGLYPLLEVKVPLVDEWLHFILKMLPLLFIVWFSIAFSKSFAASYGWTPEISELDGVAREYSPIKK